MKFTVRLLAAVIVPLVSSCDQPADEGPAGENPASPAQGAEKASALAAVAYPQEFRVANGSAVIRLISDNELEFSSGSENVVCSYTTDGKKLRMVANVLGTPQSFYYQHEPEGLREMTADGRFGPFYHNEASLIEVRKKQAAEAERLQQERLVAEEDAAKASVPTTILSKFQFGYEELKSLAPPYKPVECEISDVSIKFTVDPKSQHSFFLQGPMMNGIEGTTLTVQFRQIEKIYLREHGVGIVWHYQPELGVDKVETLNLFFRQADGGNERGKEAAKAAATDLMDAINKWKKKFPKAVIYNTTLE